jgi:CRISPR/Cas system-associated exonuclease Cas4 (RecB family)
METSAHHMQPGDIPLVKASEIEDYVFCHRGWWLSFTGQINEQTEEKAEGSALHQETANMLTAHTRNTIFGWSLVLLGLFILIILLVLHLLTLLL